MPTPLLRDRRLHALLALAAVLRVWIGADVWAHDPTTRALLSDSLYYLEWARALAAGTPFEYEGAHLAHWMPPLLPWVLLAVGVSVKAMLLLHGVLGLATTVLVVALAERMLRFSDREREDAAPARCRRSALLGGLLWTLYGPVVFFEGRLLGATLATFLATAGLWAASVWRDQRARPDAAGFTRGWALALAGLAFGCMALVRPNTLLALPALGLWVLVVARGAGAAKALLHAALFSLASALPLLPALAHNWRATGELVPITVNGGVNFYFANNPAAHGTFHAPGIEWGSIFEQREVARAQAAAALAAPELTDVEASAYWMGRGLAYLVEEPADATRLWGLKLADLLSSTEFGIQYNLAAARAVAPSLWAVGLPFGALLFLIALGWRREHARFLLPWLAAGVVSALLYFTYSRFRLPLLPPLMACAGLGLERLLRRDLLPVHAVVGLALAALSFLPFEGSYPTHLRSKAFFDMALATQAPGERLALLDRSLATLAGNKPALVERAKVHLALGDEPRALVDLEAAVRLPVDYPLAELQLANLLARANTPALRDLERARAVLTGWLAAHPPEHAFVAEVELLLAQLR